MTVIKVIDQARCGYDDCERYVDTKIIIQLHNIGKTKYDDKYLKGLTRRLCRQHATAILRGLTLDLPPDRRRRRAQPK